LSKVSKIRPAELPWRQSFALLSRAVYPLGTLRLSDPLSVGSLYTEGGVSVSVVAIIPARGGSKGVPGKNLRRVGGRALVARAVDAALLAGTIERVFVSTDDAAIAAEARAAGAEVIDRPMDISGDAASSEAAVLHAIAALSPQPDVVVFIQATSPFIDPVDLDAAVRRVSTGAEDVVFAAAESHAFLWRQGPDGAVGVNHDASVRQRRQDRDAQFQETGAFYVLRTAGFVTAGHRFFGRVGIAEVDAARALEIDTQRELELATLIAPLFDTPPLIRVDALVTDFDGVHTDDRALVDSEGRESVRVSRADGAGVDALRRAGVPVLILSRETNEVVSARGRKLGVEVRQGVLDKAAALREWSESTGIPLGRIAYVGNDLNDLPALALAGWPVAVADARPEVVAVARLVLANSGGDGAVRELADLILRGLPGTETDLHDHENHTRKGSERPWQLQLAE
jgi:YrbI family 3-deoxy-D-manno-octulosonate 8-phosphate phosphatase